LKDLITWISLKIFAIAFAYFNHVEVSLFRLAGWVHFFVIFCYTVTRKHICAYYYNSMNKDNNTQNNEAHTEDAEILEMPEIEIQSEDIESDDDSEFVEVDDEGSELSATAKLKQLRSTIKQLEKEKAENLDGWQRAKADSINKQKEFESKLKDTISFANQRLLIELIPVLDSFLIAMRNKEAWGKVDSNWRIGVEYIKSQLESVFNNHSLVVYGSVGEVADPQRYNSIETVTTDNLEQVGTVAEILQYGYTLQGKIIREAKCKTFISN
jgi:molecular chaperone GrpE